LDKSPSSKSRITQAVFLLVLLLTATMVPFQRVASSSVLGTFTFTPVADSIVSSLEPDRNYGTMEYLTIDYREHESIYTYIMFDLSKIPSGTAIANASLQLYNVDAFPSELNVSAHYCPDNGWNETEITWNSIPSFAPEPDCSVKISKTNMWYNWTLTNRLRSAVSNGDKLLTLVLELDGEPQDGIFMAAFYSKDYQQGKEYGPKLTVSTSKGSTSISCSVSRDVVPLVSNLTVFGSIEPSPGTVEVMLTYIGPSREEVRTVVSDPEGRFNDTFVPDRAGEWLVVANWSGSDFYEGAVSQQISFRVESVGPIVFFLGIIATALVAFLVIVKVRRSRRKR